MGHVLELEVAVIPLQRAAIHKDGHGGHDIGVPGVGDVIGLDPLRGLRQAQHLPQCLHELALPLLSGSGPLHLFHSVFISQADEVHLGPPLGGQEAHPVSAGFGEHPGHRHLILDLTGQQDLTGQGLPAPVVLLHQSGDGILPDLLHRGLDEVHVLGSQVPLHKVEDHKAALGLPPVEAHHVGIGEAPRHHLLALAQKLHGGDAVPELGGPLEAQLLCRPLHLHSEVIADLLIFPLQKADGLVDVLPVAALVHLRPAVAVALAHAVVEAGPLLTDVPGKLFPALGQAQGGQNGLNDTLSGPPAAVGAEVSCSVLCGPVCQGEFGVFLLHGEANIGIALVVFEQDVVPGLVAFNERALQHQGLKLAVSDDDVEVVDLAYHGPGLLGVGSQIGKVLAHPVFQGLGLAYIDDLVFGVLHDVDAGLQRQAVGFFFQFVKGHRDPPPFPFVSRRSQPAARAQRAAPSGAPKRPGPWPGPCRKGNSLALRMCNLPPGPQKRTRFWASAVGRTAASIRSKKAPHCGAF